MNKGKLIWEEDFNELLNRDFWKFDIGYVRNKELQYYTDSSENVYTENGCLVIKATKGDDENPYYSSCMRTKFSKTFLYGCLEIRAKLPYGTGIWPAFWMLGIEGKWPECGEIDILEMIGGRGNNKDYKGDKEIFSTLHYPNSPNTNGGPFYLPDKSKLCDDFHIYGMIWNEKTITFYIDDNISRVVDIEDLPMFHQPHYILLNLAVGGNWPGAPDENTEFPQKYLIDWIRYYKE